MKHQKEYQIANKEKIKEWHRNNYKSNKEKILAQIKNGRKKIGINGWQLINPNMQGIEIDIFLRPGKGR